jgi:hypothetical protein
VSDDLLQDYFRRDLGAAEDEALAKELAASPELTGRFAALAAQDYARLGLPEPAWPGREGRGMKAWLWILAASALGVGIWMAVPEHEGPAVFIANEDDRVSVEVPQANTPSQARVESTAPASAALPPLAQRLEVRASALGFAVSLEPGPGQGPLSVQDSLGRGVALVALGADGQWLWRGLDAQGRAVPAGSYRLVATAQGRSLVGLVEIARRGKP